MATLDGGAGVNGEAVMTTGQVEWKLSRRAFAAVPALMVGAAVRVFGQRAQITAGEVVKRIKEHLGVPWRDGLTDTFKAGDVDTPVTGIASGDCGSERYAW